MQSVRFESKKNIPQKSNLLLLILVMSGMLFLLFLASQLSLIWSVPIGIAFSFLMLTNYALMHEAMHRNAAEKSLHNSIFGAVSGFMFPIAYTIMAVTHRVHHECNRTDHEMFDYYYPSDNLFLKYGQWYSILSGIYFFALPLGSVLMAIAPWLVHTKPFKKAKSSNILFLDFDKNAIKTLRLEVIGGLVFWALIWNFLGLNWQSVLVLYAFAGFNWSTRQYVTHAYTVRDIRDGALNLKTNKLMEKILLNGHWDLVHHQSPNLAWHELADYAEHYPEPISYWKQYLRLWAGPKPNVMPEPEMHYKPGQ